MQLPFHKCILENRVSPPLSYYKCLTEYGHVLNQNFSLYGTHYRRAHKMSHISPPHATYRS